MPLGDVDRLTKRNLRIRVGSGIKRDQQLAFEPEQLWSISRDPLPAVNFAHEVGCYHAAACANGTVALHLVLTALGIGPGDEVILPAFTMIATANAVKYTGATIRLVDSEPIHSNVDPALIERSVTKNTKAIIVVHTYGHPAEIHRLLEMAKAHGFVVIEDAAEAHGAEVSGKRVGGFGIAGTFSFYANKIITTGEGGMVTTMILSSIELCEGCVIMLSILSGTSGMSTSGLTIE